MLIYSPLLTIALIQAYHSEQSSTQFLTATAQTPSTRLNRVLSAKTKYCYPTERVREIFYSVVWNPWRFESASCVNQGEYSSFLVCRISVSDWYLRERRGNHQQLRPSLSNLTCSRNQPGTQNSYKEEWSTGKCWLTLGW